MTGKDLYRILVLKVHGVGKLFNQNTWQETFNSGTICKDEVTEEISQSL